MDVPDWLVIYTIIGMVIMGNFYYRAFPKLDSNFSHTQRVVVTLVLWLLSTVVWPFWMFYALFIYRSKP